MTDINTHLTELLEVKNKRIIDLELALDISLSKAQRHMEQHMRSLDALQSERDAHRKTSMEMTDLASRMSDAANNALKMAELVMQRTQTNAGLMRKAALAKRRNLR